MGVIGSVVMSKYLRLSGIGFWISSIDVDLKTLTGRENITISDNKEIVTNAFNFLIFARLLIHFV
jgi:hypothetical protein